MQCSYESAQRERGIRHNWRTTPSVPLSLKVDPLVPCNAAMKLHRERQREADRQRQRDRDRDRQTDRQRGLFSALQCNYETTERGGGVFFSAMQCNYETVECVCLKVDPLVPCNAATKLHREWDPTQLADHTFRSIKFESRSFSAMQCSYETAQRVGSDTSGGPHLPFH